MPCIIKNYRAATRKAAEETYKKIVDLKCTHKTSSASWDEMVRNKSVTCNAAASIALQKAGCLPVGVRVGHVSTKGKKEWQINTIEQAMYGSDRLKHCRLVWVDCKYKDLPAWLKKEGTVYIQWSNACVSAGKGWVWSCNQQGGYHEGHYTVYKNGVLANKDTYPFGGRIFVCIVPDEKWRQHYAVEAILGLHGNGEERKERFGRRSSEGQQQPGRGSEGFLPAEGAVEAERGVKGGTGDLGVVKGHPEVVFGQPDIRPPGQQLRRNPDLKVPFIQ